MYYYCFISNGKHCNWIILLFFIRKILQVQVSALLFISLCVDDEMISCVQDLPLIIIHSHAKDYELVLLLKVRLECQRNVQVKTLYFCMVVLFSYLLNLAFIKRKWGGGRGKLNGMPGAFHVFKCRCSVDYTFFLSFFGMNK